MVASAYQRVPHRPHDTGGGGSQLCNRYVLVPALMWALRHLKAVRRVRPGGGRQSAGELVYRGGGWAKRMCCPLDLVGDVGLYE